MTTIGVRIALFSAYFLFAILLNSVGTVILQSMRSFGVEHAEAALLEGFKDLPIAIVSFLVASFLPRVGYRRSMIIGFGIVAAACLFMPLAPGFLTTKLMFLAVGVSFALIKVSVYSTIGLITHDSNAHASTLNFIEGFFMIGVFAGYWLFAAFIDNANPASLSWLNVYWLLSGLSVANILVLLCVNFPQPPKREGGADLIGDFRDMLSLLAAPAVLVFVISAFLYVLIEQGMGTWFPTFIAEELFVPEAMSIQLTSIFAVSLAIGRLSAGGFLRFVDWYWLINGCVVMMAVLMLFALPLASGHGPRPDMTWFNAPIPAYVLPLVGLTLAPIYPAINSVILSSLPRARHAAMAGLIVVFSALGGTTGSFIVGRLFGEIGGQKAFYTILIPMMGILIALFYLKRLTGEKSSAQNVATSRGVSQ